MAAIVTPIGSEFKVNTYLSGYQYESSIAALQDDNFVVVWTSVDQDGSGSGVYAQRYSSTSEPIGNELRVNSFTAGEQRFPSVSMLSDGGFVVVWASEGQDGSSWGVYAQRFSPDGENVGPEFHVNTVDSGRQWFPKVASFSDGTFVVVWWAGNNSDTPIVVQRYDALGNKIGSEIQVADEGCSPEVTTLSDGGFIVTYASSSGNIDRTLDILATRFDASGEAVGNEFKVNTFAIDNQSGPHVATLADGGFIIVWTTYRFPEGSGYDVRGQLYNAQGEAAGGEILINELAPTSSSGVSALPSGGFVVVWTSNGQDGSASGVAGRVFDSTGNPKTD